MKKITTDRIIRKTKRVRSKISGTREIPKITVFRSNRYLYAQAVDDENGTTIVSASSYKKSKAIAKSEKKTDQSKEAGNDLAQKLLKKGVKKAVFDRGPYKYLGRVKAFVEGLREGGIQV